MIIIEKMTDVLKYTTGSEIFTKHVIDDSFYGASSISTADVDNDGDQDIFGVALSGGISWWDIW